MKIHLESKDRRYDDRLKFIVDGVEILRKNHEIEFVNDAKECDIYMSHQTLEAPDLEDAYASKKPIIILQRADSANIANEKMREAIKASQVVGFFKITNFKDPQNHNEKTSGDNRYHLNFINDKYDFDEYENKFSKNDLKKIKCALPAFYNFRFDHVRSTRNHFQHERPVDLNFAGIVDYSGNKNYKNMDASNRRYEIVNLLNSHRKLAYERANEYGNSYKNRKVVSHYGKPYTQPQYWQSLFLSKLSLSPWGFGAYNWRDYETIYLGGILVKPDTDFLESYCDLYQSEKYYFKCDPNFKDLETVCENIINNYNESIQKTKLAQRSLSEHFSITKICERFARQINECIE